MVRALIVYGTRYGATANTSKIIGEILQQQGFEVSIFNLKNDVIQSITDYDLIIVGSGIQMGRWTKEPERFLQRYSQELSQKKLALFVSSGSAHPLSAGEEKEREKQEAFTKYLKEKATKYNVNPIDFALFGGVYDFNKMNWFFRKTMSPLKLQLVEAGFKEVEPGRFDTRDLKKICSWALKLTQFSS